MRRLWLIFAQACTICLALLFVVTTLRPEWLSRTAPNGSSQVVMMQEDLTPGIVPASAHVMGSPVSYAEAVKKAMMSLRERRGAACKAARMANTSASPNARWPK